MKASFSREFIKLDVWPENWIEVKAPYWLHKRKNVLVNLDQGLEIGKCYECETGWLNPRNKAWDKGNDVYTVEDRIGQRHYVVKIIPQALTFDSDRSVILMSDILKNAPVPQEDVRPVMLRLTNQQYETWMALGSHDWLRGVLNDKV